MTTSWGCCRRRPGRPSLSCGAGEAAAASGQGAGIAAADLLRRALRPARWLVLLLLALTLAPTAAAGPFRAPGFLAAHPGEVIAAALVIVLQGALIAWLLAERRRRRLAELAEQRQRFALIHASRVAVAGQLTGAIAHEINQPLGAILCNADAAELILEADTGSNPARDEQLRAIIADIRRDDLRASEVIRRLRVLLERQRAEPSLVDVADAAVEVGAVLRTEALRRRQTLAIRPPAVPAIVMGDRIQLQQIMIILAINAMDAMADAPEERRRVVVGIEPRGEEVLITVADRGNGIAAGQLEKVFEPFFTTKPTGMGLGLSIARTLAEAHQGRILAENRPGGGALFTVALPAGGAANGDATRSA